jgi:hypothetical protein
MLWWVMNDVAGEHTRSKTPPIQIEIQATAFAFEAPRSPIGNTTFYRYKLLYKGSTAFRDAYVGLFIDPDLGNFMDDFAGSDTTLQLAYAYNGDNSDTAYGDDPPALGITLLQGPRVSSPVADSVRHHGMTAFLVPPDDGGPGGWPLQPEQFLNYMQGRWKDGQPLTLGASGLDPSNPPISFHYPGDPVARAFWSELNIDGNGLQNLPSDRQFFMFSGPFTMQPGDEQEVSFAIVWSRGKDHLDSVRQLKVDTARLQEDAAFFLTPHVEYGVSDVPLPTYSLGFAENYPNPFSVATTIRYSLPQPMQVRLAVYDVLGREVAVLADQAQAAGIYAVDFEAGGLPAGVYLYRIELDHLRFSKTMILVR